MKIHKLTFLAMAAVLSTAALSLSTTPPAGASYPDAALASPRFIAAQAATPDYKFTICEGETIEPFRPNAPVIKSNSNPEAANAAIDGDGDVVITGKKAGVTEIEVEYTTLDERHQPVRKVMLIRVTVMKCDEQDDKQSRPAAPPIEIVPLDLSRLPQLGGAPMPPLEGFPALPADTGLFPPFSGITNQDGTGATAASQDQSQDSCRCESLKLEQGTLPAIGRITQPNPGGGEKKPYHIQLWIPFDYRVTCEKSDKARECAANILVNTDKPKSKQFDANKDKPEEKWTYTKWQKDPPKREVRDVKPENRTLKLGELAKVNDEYQPKVIGEIEGGQIKCTGKCDGKEVHYKRYLVYEADLDATDGLPVSGKLVFWLEGEGCESAGAMRIEVNVTFEKVNTEKGSTVSATKSEWGQITVHGTPKNPEPTIKTGERPKKK